jgi:uridylate kinase
MVDQPLYKTVLIKLSGEALKGGASMNGDFFCPLAGKKIGDAISRVHAKGVKIGIVVGGGNIFRGVQAEGFGFHSVSADQIGMVATVINGLVLQQVLRGVGCKSVVMSSFDAGGFVEKYNWQNSLAYLNSGMVVIFVGGIGTPCFTTDVAGALRAIEINADILIKATKVDGVYNKDPMKYSDAVKLERLTYSDVIFNKLEVMDIAAIALCRKHKIPIRVIDFLKCESFFSAIFEKKGGSLVS